MSKIRAEHIAYASAAVVAAVAAVVSFEHMRYVGRVAGEEWRSWLIPLSVDGQLISATLVAWFARKQGRGIPGITLASLVLGLWASVGANIVAALLAGSEALPESWEWLPVAVGVWPPVALALAFESVLRLRDLTSEPRAADQEVSASAPSTPEPVPAGVEEAAPEPVESVPTVEPLPEPVESVPTVELSLEPPTASPTSTEPLRDTRAEALDFAKSVLSSGGVISGASLALMYGKPDRWGRSVLEEARSDLGVVNGHPVGWSIRN